MATSRRRDPRGGPRGGTTVDPDDARAARAAALNSLARRDRSSAALRRQLVDKGFTAGAAADVVERLCADKLVDDHRYVENFVSYHAARGQGPIRIRADLRQSGLQGELVDRALEAYPDWLAQLRKAYHKKFGGRPADDPAERQRRARFLGYRGYTGAQIRMALGFDTDLDVDVTP